LISVAFSRDLLAIASLCRDIVKLYDLRTRTRIISTLQHSSPLSLAISPDSTRLAARDLQGDVHLWDIPSIKASDPDSEKESSGISCLAFSPNYSRLAAGFVDGTIMLWCTDQAGQPITTHKLHSKGVSALAFSPDGEQLASGSWDRTVRVWNGRDGSTNSVIERTFPSRLFSVAFSNDLLAAATKDNITTWDRKTLDPIDAIKFRSLTLPSSAVIGVSLSFQMGSSLLAIACGRSDKSSVTVWDTEGRTVLATFQVNSNIRNLTLSPDGSQVFAEIEGVGFRLFDVSTGNAIQQTGREELGWIPNFNGIPISWKNGRGNRLVGRFSDRYEHVPLLYCPTEVQISSVTVGSSMLAVGCEDGGILFVRS
jgi:WD40 repeat protein